MRVIEARNVHEALPKAIALLLQHGVRRDSRNGPVLMFPEPVTTVYERPWERVIFWPERDANPFLHLYEALWMLCGRNDVEPLLRYSKQFAQYSDDGVTQHAAYGHRWRRHFAKDQVEIVVARLLAKAEDRRAVIAMWDPRVDAFAVESLSDVPCNLAITFQVSNENRLDMTVFNRSNDMVWGAYGANAVHMSALQEYVACRISTPIGRYWQVSVNLHAYEKTLTPALRQLAGEYQDLSNPYDLRTNPCPLVAPVSLPALDKAIHRIVSAADIGEWTGSIEEEPQLRVLSRVLHAHHIYKTGAKEGALDFIRYDGDWDWAVAARQWLYRRIFKEQK